MSGLVSIIVPVYNAAPYIAKTIEMVRQQTYEEWELILVNDASQDNSLQVIEKSLDGYERYREEGDQPDIEWVDAYTAVRIGTVKVINKTHNEGAAKARNTGLSVATGRYIAFLDADDVWLPDKLSKELSFMEERQAGFVFSAYEFGDEQAHPTGRIVHVPDKLTYRKALSRTVIFTTTVLLDRTIIPDRLMRMPEVASEDTATWWQILREGYVAYGLDEVLAVYRRPARSLSSNKLTAIKRIWYLYRRQEGLSLPESIFYFVFWAYRATVRRI